MNSHANSVILKALQTIREFRNLLQSNEVVDAREIEMKLAQLLGGKACWECGDKTSCQCCNDE